MSKFYVTSLYVSKLIKSQAENALKDQKIRLATSVVNLVTFHVIAPTQQLRALDVVVSNPVVVVVVVDLRSATRYDAMHSDTFDSFNTCKLSAAKPVTLQETALMLEDIHKVDSVVNKVVDTVVAPVVLADSVVPSVVRPAILVVDTGTCLVSSSLSYLSKNLLMA